MPDSIEQVCVRGQRSLDELVDEPFDCLDPSFTLGEAVRRRVVILGVGPTLRSTIMVAMRVRR